MGSLYRVSGDLAATQHGRVTRRQLLSAGVDSSRIDRWLADGWLHRVHRGVYAVGHLAPSLHADYHADVLACGSAARLSHRAQAHLLKVHEARRPPPAEVTIASTAGRRRPGVVVHRVPELHPLDTWTFDAIAMTSLPRLLVDLAPLLSLAELSRACHEARVRYRTSPAQVIACMHRNPRRPGARRLRAALEGDVTLSPLETGFLALLHRHRLPLPRTNIDHVGDKVDCHWPQIGLTVELLSYRYHGSRHAFETDVAASAVEPPRLHPRRRLRARCPDSARAVTAARHRLACRFVGHPAG